MKIVIDTNLLIASMFNKRSASFKILEMARQGSVEVAWSDKIRKEAQLIVGKISRALPQRTIDLNEIFKPACEVKNLPDVRGVCEDKDDDKFFACAVGAGADMVVSNDKHLLDVKHYRNIPVYTAKVALRHLNQ